MSENPLTVYYDGGCPLCRREIDFYRQRTGADVAYQDICAIDGADVAADLSKQDALQRFHVRDESGALVDGAAAFATLWRATPGFRRLGAWLNGPPWRAVAEAFYRLFLILRPGLQWAVRRIDRSSTG